MDQYSLVARIYIATLISCRKHKVDKKRGEDAEKWNACGKITKENCVGRLGRKSLLGKLSTQTTQEICKFFSESSDRQTMGKVTSISINVCHHHANATIYESNLGRQQISRNKLVNFAFDTCQSLAKHQSSY